VPDQVKPSFLTSGHSDTRSGLLWQLAGPGLKALGGLQAQDTIVNTLRCQISNLSGRTDIQQRH